MKAEAIKAEKRTKVGTADARRLRKRGMIPAVLYGHKQEPVHLAVEGREIERMIDAGQRTVDISYDGQTESALIKEVQYDAMGDAIIHVDFTRIALDERVSVSVPIVPFGTPAGVNEGGVLEQVLKEIDIECLATNIPSEIKVDVNQLQMGESLLVRDLKLPEGVICKEDPEAIVFTITEPEEEVEAAPEEEAAQPEVISEKEREERAEEREKKEAESEEKSDSEK